MSDPVTNVDIEDVLASIRRLVSGGAEHGQSDSRTSKEAERLVLTPSQRVDEADEAPVTVEPDSAAEAVRQIMPEPESDADSDSDDDTDAVFALSTSSGIWRDDAGRESLADAVRDTDEPDAATEAWEPVGATDAWEPDGDDEDFFSDKATSPALEWRDADDDEYAPGDASSAPEGEAVSVDPDDIAADEAASAFYGRDWDSEDVEEEDGDAMALAIDEAVLDDDALRDLVAEIVREELMGTLGERITRNVRKLVRREIHRALNSQDFD